MRRELDVPKIIMSAPAVSSWFTAEKMNRFLMEAAAGAVGDIAAGFLGPMVPSGPLREGLRFAVVRFVEDQLVA